MTVTDKRKQAYEYLRKGGRQTLRKLGSGSLGVPDVANRDVYE